MNVRKRRVLLISLAVALLLCLFLIVWSFVIEPDRLVVNRVTVSLPDWPTNLNGLKIALFSDIHAGSPHIDDEKLRKIVSLVNQSQPDLIVIPGDFVIQGVKGGHFVTPEQIAGGLKGLNAPLGVYAVLGNHDWLYDGDRITNALRVAGIQILENDVAHVEREGQAFWLVGLADLWTRPQNISGTLQKVTDSQPIIAFTHNPDIFPQTPARVSLTLAGHTHGGQVNLPFIGRRVVPSKFKQRYAAGLIQEEGRQLFVTTGIGTSIIPVRFRVPPEIVILTIQKQ